jgi:putative Mg2+ transporter-C (MgtC) family protein
VHLRLPLRRDHVVCNDAYRAAPSMTNSWLDPIMRLGAAILVGGAIGWERQLRGRPAGLRTHMLVSLGAAVVVSIPLETGSGDTSRVIQGVATGIGFLCAGDILHQVREGREQVKGLTSAAALWVTAALGMVAATGLWGLALVGTLSTVLILTVARRLERLIPKPPAAGDDH